MEEALKMNMLYILSKNGSVWQLIDIGISITNIINMLKDMVRENLIVNKDYIYFLTEEGKTLLQQYQKSKKYHRNYIIYNMKYRMKPIEINEIYIPKVKY